VEAYDPDKFTMLIAQMEDVLDGYYGRLKKARRKRDSAHIQFCSPALRFPRIARR